MKYRVLGVVVCFLCFAAQVYGDSSFDRELIIKNQGRADKVETVLRNLLRAYENEDAREFLDYVSEDRFRQDYLTFTDALYSDFRTYEIFRVDYWLDRVVPDNVKQFLYVRWEKRYETLDDAQQLTQRGFSRFLFDEVNGEYLLVELAGNDLFGASLAEWSEETPSIPGQEAPPVNNSGGAATPVAKADLAIQSVQAVSISSLSVIIANTGQAASQSTTVSITYPPGPIDSFTQNIDAINSGDSFNLIIPYYDASPISVTLITIDPNNIVPESNESNNTGGPYSLGP
jgi:hypothetical protein